MPRRSFGEDDREATRGLVGVEDFTTPPPSATASFEPNANPAADTPACLNQRRRPIEISEKLDEAEALDVAMCRPHTIAVKIASASVPNPCVELPSP